MEVKVVSISVEGKIKEYLQSHDGTGAEYVPEIEGSKVYTDTDKLTVVSKKGTKMASIEIKKIGSRVCYSINVTDEEPYLDEEGKEKVQDILEKMGYKGIRELPVSYKEVR